MWRFVPWILLAMLADVGILHAARIRNLALNGATFQSSVSTNGDASRAVDGSRKIKYNQNSCSHTSTYQNPWWAVDLNYVYDIDFIIITNRADKCCYSRLSNLRIGTTNVNPDTTTPTLQNIDVCASQEAALKAGESKTISCVASARYVVVMLEKIDSLTLCEVEVYHDKWTSFNGHVYYINPDERYTEDKGKAACGGDASYLLRLDSDMEATFVLGLIKQFHPRLPQIWVDITHLPGDAADDWRMTGGQPATGNFWHPNAPNNNMKQGRLCTRFTKRDSLYLLDDTGCSNRYGFVCEKTAVENIALGKRTFQSSTYKSAFANRAIDRVRFSTEYFSCTHTLRQTNPWWAVDLQVESTVRTVSLTNRAKCCERRLSHIRIGTTNYDPGSRSPTLSIISVCASDDKSMGRAETKTFQCGGNGRYLVVLLAKRDILTLCEVEVFTECPNGLWNSRCTSECSSACANVETIGCDPDSGFCNACEHGMFSSFCEGICPNTCSAAGCKLLTGVCHDCVIGRYNIYCQTPCPTGCQEQLGCESRSGDCVECKSGLYNNRCQSTCPTGCEDCRRLTGECVSCHLGVWGSNCDQQCGHCSSGSCNKITSECIASQWDTLCMTGYFAMNCDVACPSNCGNINGCEMDGECSSCRDGFHGIHCNKSCPTNCKTGCEYSTGYCNDGCKAGYFGAAVCENMCSNHCNRTVCKQDTGHCTICNAGYHGSMCTTLCIAQCEGGECLQSNGMCPMECAVGYYGDLCSDPCSTGCMDHELTKINPDKCHQRSGECSPCKTGVFGENCRDTCSQNCHERTCDQYTGNCILGCKFGYQGARCEERCGHCGPLYCDRDGTCPYCEPGFYGSKCSNLCPDLCYGAMCNNQNGMCEFGCYGNFYQVFCDQQCAAECVDTCDWIHGTCDLCQPGRYGTWCNEYCSHNCLNPTSCSRLTGICDGGCKDGFTGTQCTQKVSENGAIMKSDPFNGRQSSVTGR